MVRTFKNPQGGSLGGCFEPGGGTLGGTGANHNGTFSNGHHTGGEFDSSRRVRKLKIYKYLFLFFLLWFRF